MNKFFMLVSFIVILTFQECKTEKKYLGSYRHHFNVKNHHDTIKQKYIEVHFEDLKRDCPKLSQEFAKADQHFEECLTRTLSDHTITMCTKLETVMLNCYEHTYRKVVDDCVCERGRGVFSLLVKMFASSIDYLCKQTGETIIDNCNHSYVDNDLVELSRSCLWNDLQVSHEFMEQCEEKIKNRAIHYRSNGFAATEICRDALEIRNCLDARITMTCKCRKTKEAFLGLHNATLAPCRDILHK